MAGSASNWFRPQAGAVRGQKIFIRNSTLQALGMNRAQALAALQNNDKKTFKAVANQQPLTGTIKSKADARLKQGSDSKALNSASGIEFRKDDAGVNGQVLNGIPLTRAKDDAWKNHTDANIGEPPWPKSRKRKATGVIVVEPDGRVWMYKPSMNYAGYQNTFSGGGLEKGLSGQQNARKEALEEMGLDVEITGYLGDVKTQRDVRRYYIARRKGGTPTDATWEAESVRLIPNDQLDDYLNKPLDKQLIGLMQQQGLAPAAAAASPASPATSTAGGQPAGQAKKYQAYDGSKDNGRFQGNNTVTYGDRSFPVLASQGSLAVIKTRSGHRVIDPATGRKVGSSFSSQSQAEQYMQQQAATAPTHHSVKYLDSAGRANRTVRAETLPHPGTNRNTIDDVFKMHGNLASAARLAKKNDKAPTRAGGVRGDVLLSSIQQAHGFDALPQKVNKQTLDNMLKSGDVSRMMYRAAGGFERDYQDGTMFSAGDNGRRMGAGAYAGSSTSISRGGKNEANLSNVKNYIKGFGRVAQTNTVRMGLRADARTIGHREMRRERKQWVARERARLSRSDPNYQDKVAVIDAFERDPGYYAAAMGYDAVISDRKDFRGFTGVMILNRSATVVQDTIESIT